MTRSVRLGDPSVLDEIDDLTGRQFERFVADLFERLGYEAELTDYYLGADVILTRNGERIAVQAKRAANPVRRRAVQAVAAALPAYRCSSGMVVTNASFTWPARELARVNAVALWGRRELEEAILEFCALCGHRVSPRVRAWCLDRRSEYGGRVYCFDHQRNLRGLLAVADEPDPGLGSRMAG